MAINKIIIVTAPSGAGKTSIVHYLLQQHPTLLGFSISAATRSKRANEVDGVDYHFRSTETFNLKINNNEFIEWEMVYDGKYYGTLKSEIEKLWSQGKTPVLDIDVKGAIHVQEQFKKNSLSIFIQPPSITALTQRLQSRGTETAESLQARVDKASYELSFKHHFNTIIVNDDLDEARKKTEEVVLDFLNAKP
jgi:guanylate kinase